MKLLSKALIIFILGGCSFRQWMYQQPVVKPLSESDFFADGRSARLPVENTIARGELNLDEGFRKGKMNGKILDKFPMALTREFLKRGQERYEIFCTPCHDYTGYGNGMIVQRGFQRPPSFHDERLRTSPVGHFVEVMAEGWGAMSSYASQVEPSDRWAIAAYIRALQRSQSSTLSDVPQVERGKLEGSNDEQ